ncbi:16031_t:CDS:2 [Gigaspora rosea]|nr:16031_t:CDS:2 [Gigaspora rosea]
MKKLMPWINEASVVHKDSLEEIVEMQHQYRRALLRLITGHDTGENNDSVNDEGAWCLRDGCKACQTNSLLKILDLNERFELGIRLIQKIFKKISQFLRYKRCMNEKIARIETLVQHLIERTVLDINVPRVDSLLLSDPPRADDSEINFEDEPDRNSEWDLDDCAQTKGIVKKIYKRGVEVACVFITVFGQNMSILSELKKFNESCSYWYMCTIKGKYVN